MIIFFLFILGIFLGSFLGMLADRLPKGFFFFPLRSQCPQCKTQIAWYDNLPLISYLILRAKCRHCKKTISAKYFWSEGLTGALFVLLYFHFPFAADLNALSTGDVDVYYLRKYLHAAILVCFFIPISVVDFEWMIIPDELNFGLILAIPLAVLLHPGLGATGALLGALAGGVTIWAIAWLYYFVRKATGIGFGDVKLLFGMGGWLGLESIFPTLMIASVSGSVVGIGWMLYKRSLDLKVAIPFGPFLCVGGFVFLLYWKSIQQIIF